MMNSLWVFLPACQYVKTQQNFNCVQKSNSFRKYTMQSKSSSKLNCNLTVVLSYHYCSTYSSFIMHIHNSSDSWVLAVSFLPIWYLQGSGVLFLAVSLVLFTNKLFRTDVSMISLLSAHDIKKIVCNRSESKEC